MKLVCLDLFFSFHQILSYCYIGLRESICCLFHMPRWWAVCDSSSPQLCRCYGNTRYRATTKAFSVNRSGSIRKPLLSLPSCTSGERIRSWKLSSPKQPKPVASVRCSSRQNHQVGKVLQIKTIFTSYSCIHSCQRVRDRHCQCKLCSVLKVSCRKIVPPLPP